MRKAAKRRYHYASGASGRGAVLMSMFEYVMVLASIVIGLAMTHLLQGVASLVQHPGRHKIYWVHLVWVAFMFLYSIFWWWFEFRLQTIATWSFPVYLFIILYAFLIYLACALLFPSDLQGYSGFKDYFYSRRRWFFGLQAIIALSDVADTLIKGQAHISSFGIEYWIQVGVTTTAVTLGAIIRNERFHAALAILMLAYMSYVALRYFLTMG